MRASAQPPDGSLSPRQKVNLAMKVVEGMSIAQRLAFVDAARREMPTSIDTALALAQRVAGDGSLAVVLPRVAHERGTRLQRLVQRLQDGSASVRSNVRSG
jgi:hypothetical protein